MVKLPDPDFVKHYILKKYRPYSELHCNGVNIWGTMSHNDLDRIITEYADMVIKCNPPCPTKS